MTAEIEFAKVAYIGEQYSLEGRGSGRLDGPPRQGHDVLRGKLGEATVYMTYGAGELRDQHIVAVAPFAPDTLELKIERPGADKYIAAALTQLALFEYVKDKSGGKTKVISFIPLNDNPETDTPLQPLFGEVLGMEGQSVYTSQNEVIYVGDLAEVHGNAVHALRQSRPPLSIRPTPPASAA